MRIGYIGIGIMGGAMAGRLLEAGHTLFIYNRTPTKCQALADRGATVCANPADVACRSEVVFISVPDTQDVASVLFDPDGIIDGAEPGLIVVDTSTISPAATRQFARRLKDLEIELLDAPVSGGDIGAKDGTLAIMVGGDTLAFQKVLPLLQVLGSKVRLVGPAGAGQTCKAINQLFSGLHMLACCEGIALARKTGLNPSVVIDMISAGAGGSWVLKNLGPKIVSGDMEPGFMIDLLCKDLKYTMELAQQTGQPLVGGSLIQQLFSEAQQMGLGRSGTQALYKVIEQLGQSLDTGESE
ncbi:MAG: NAD(P)-dependent oxidoreductase [Sedimentisphaerales bacterium]|jgi:3-hydroxyisobutyrate dehydrogenase|nr:NAD(P)-dependent oxidoreductase [Sedimentisphaerales bacterium]